MHDIDPSEPLWVIHLKMTLSLTHAERKHGQKMLLIAQRLLILPRILLLLE
jgi:hypothetical protein